MTDPGPPPADSGPDLAEGLARLAEAAEGYVPSQAPLPAATQTPSPSPAPAAGGEPKSRLLAGLLGIFLGGLGVHRFYLGYHEIGLVQLLLTVVAIPLLGCLTCGMGFALAPFPFLWGLVEGILILCQNTITTDAQGRPLKE